MSKNRLNVQGLARREPDLMGALVPDDGNVVVSNDLLSGEPTVTAHLSRDPNYLYAAFDGVGKAPYYKGGLLMIDDIYIMTMSVSPIGAEELRQHFHEGRFEGMSFVDAWMKDPEIVKKALKKSRQLHKMLCLSGDTLVRVRGRGWQRIADVRAGDYVFDGTSWVATTGPIYKGFQETIDYHGVRMTPDHPILTHQGWKAADDKIPPYKKEGPSGTWADVWSMAGVVIRSPETWGVPLHLCRLWMRACVEAVRQRSKRQKHQLPDVPA